MGIIIKKKIKYTGDDKNAWNNCRRCSWHLIRCACQPLICCWSPVYTGKPPGRARRMAKTTPVGISGVRRWRCPCPERCTKWPSSKDYVNPFGLGYRVVSCAYSYELTHARTHAHTHTVTRRKKITGVVWRDRLRCTSTLSPLGRCYTRCYNIIHIIITCARESVCIIIYLVFDCVTYIRSRHI